MKEPMIKTCEMCSVTFNTHNSRQKYCSESCCNKVISKKIKLRQKAVVQNIQSNAWKHSKEGIQLKFQELFSPTCQLCLSKEDVVSKLMVTYTDWRCIAPDSWQHLCKSCLETIESYNKVFDESKTE